MRLPDIPAIGMGGFMLFCLIQKVEAPAALASLADNAFVATCLAGIEKYPTATTICLFIVAGALLLSGILRIWLDNSSVRYLWGVGSGALAALLMIMLNETVFGWAWTCDLYSAGTTEVVMTGFHFCWLFICPFAALFAAVTVADERGIALPEPVYKAALPFWAIPASAVVGFLASMVLWAVLLVLLIPLNYLFLVVDTVFIVVALIFTALFIGIVL